MLDNKISRQLGDKIDINASVMLNHAFNMALSIFFSSN